MTNSAGNQNEPMSPVPTVPRIENHSKAISRILSRTVLAAAVLFIVGAASLYAFRASYDEKIYPGVYAGGVSLGGMTEAEARVALETRANEIESQRAYFDSATQHWAPTLEELGVEVNIESTLDAALEVGREDSSKSRIVSELDTLREDTLLPLTIELSNDELESWAQGVDEDLGIRPKSASLSIDTVDVIVDPESNGTIVDRAALQSIVLKEASALRSPTAPLPVIDEHPSVYASDLEPTRQQLTTALSAAVEIEHDGESWKMPPEVFGQHVSVSIDPALSGSEAVSIDIDQRAIAEWLTNEVGPSVNKDPVNAKVAWNGEKLIAITPSSEGTRMLPSSLTEEVAASFLSNHEPVAVPIQVLTPEVDGSNLDSLGVTTKLAAASSNFDGSDNARATNIGVGTNLLNGTLVPPGGEFSFNRAIGVISEELGYVEAGVIEAERVGRDIGGGICQVSTTVYRASLYAGLPIIEWHPHTYRLGFYELDGWQAGLDASILQPDGNPFGGGDYRFVNPSDSWMLVEAYVEWPRVYVVIYGADLGYTVDVSEPYVSAPIPPTGDVEVVDYELPSGSMMQTEFPQNGLNTIYYRTVYDADGNVVLEDDWDTYFSPRGNVWKVSPDMQGLSPAA